MSTPTEEAKRPDVAWIRERFGSDPDTFASVVELCDWVERLETECGRLTGDKHAAISRAERAEEALEFDEEYGKGAGYVEALEGFNAANEQCKDAERESGRLREQLSAATGLLREYTCDEAGCNCKICPRARAFLETVDKGVP